MAMACLKPIDVLARLDADGRRQPAGGMMRARAVVTGRCEPRAARKMNLDEIYVKTELGTKELVERQMGLAIDVRRLLILVDGKHTVAQILARGRAFHANVAAFDGPRARGPGRPPLQRALHRAGAMPDLPSAAPTRSSDFLDAQKALSNAINEHLGFRGYGLMMRLQKAENLRDLHEMLPDFAQALVKRKGMEAATPIVTALEQMIVRKAVMQQAAAVAAPTRRSVGRGTGRADRRPFLRQGPGRIRRRRRQDRAAGSGRPVAQMALPEGRHVAVVARAIAQQAVGRRRPAQARGPGHRARADGTRGHRGREFPPGHARGLGPLATTRSRRSIPG